MIDLHAHILPSLDDGAETLEDSRAIARAAAAEGVEAIAATPRRMGKSSRAAAFRLLELGLVDVLASDLHTPAIREARLGEAACALKDAGLARHLTEDAPRAIVAGEELPKPPAYRRRRFFG
ncbi:MAG: CpsB/CapC family capsule biosynthesis tyrosine phosphatase [Gaiellales bacterium]